MKYYFISFSLLMSASVMAMNTDDQKDNDQDTSHLSTKMGKQEASDRKLESLEPSSSQRLNSVMISAFDPTGLTPEEHRKALIAALLKANPGLHLPIPKED